MKANAKGLRIITLDSAIDMCCCCPCYCSVCCAAAAVIIAGVGVELRLLINSYAVTFAHWQFMQPAAETAF